MSIVMPVFVVLETTIILWLLVVLARRQGGAASIASIKPPGSSAHEERVLLSLDAMFARIARTVVEAGSFRSPAKTNPSGGTGVEASRVAGVSSVTEAGQRGARAEHQYTDGPGAAASARVVRRDACTSGGRSMDIPHAQAAPPERKSGQKCFREALALFPFAILMLGERGRMVMVNPQAAKLFGYECSEMIGRPVELLVPDLRFESVAPFWADRFALPDMRGAAPLRELSARRKNGVVFPVEIGLNAFSFDDDCVTLAFVIDRTDRYELHRNRQALAHLTRVSTMGQLASSLAHELNQPLTAILSNVQAAQRFMTTDPIDLTELREILNDIVQDNYRASEVIRRIRVIVRKGDLEVAPLNLAEVVRDVVLLVHSDAIVRGTRLMLDIDDTLPPVRGDKVQLQQVMLNLLLNAFDAMNDVPPVDRMVVVTVKSQGSDMVCIAVRDNGHGLTADKLDKIFKPFFTSKPLGLGLGLSISRSIIDFHSGRLWAENNTDRGATFYVTLPANDATQHDESR
jgi:two-component system sensor kinase FixL